MLTVTQLARACGLSRSAVLYYESIGLLRPAGRTEANYRRYGKEQVDRLRQICVYRNAGVALEDIRSILARDGRAMSTVLKRRLLEIDAEIQKLRDHQSAVLRLLRSSQTMKRMDRMTKEKWVSVMKGAGFSEADMRRWHAGFERSAPAEHQEFLEFLNEPTEEIARIREWSRG